MVVCWRGLLLRSCDMMMAGRFLGVFEDMSSLDGDWLREIPFRNLTEGG